MSTAVNKAGWMLVDGSRIRQLDLVAFVGKLYGRKSIVVNSEFFTNKSSLLLIASEYY